jgi:hypothetical protein
MGFYMYYFQQQLSNLSVRAIYCSVMPEDNERRFYRGSARWIIIGIVAALAVIFVVVVAFGSTLFPSGPRTGGMQSETADQSATSGPGHNTTTGGGMNLWEVRKKKLLLAPVQALSKSRTQISLLAERQVLKTHLQLDDRV